MASRDILDGGKAGEHPTTSGPDGLRRLTILLARQAAADHVAAMLAERAASGYGPDMAGTFTE